MSKFESGVSHYITGTAKVVNNFPVDFKGNAYINCEKCFYYNRNSYRCELTHEKPEFPNQYVGGSCPLEFENE